MATNATADDIAAQSASPSGAGPEAEARDDCDLCVTGEFPCFDHFEARCAEGHEWCGADGYDAPQGAVCLTCAGIAFGK